MIVETTTPAGGPWTRHGHAVPGVTVAGPRPAGMKVARCGGPGLCHPCGMDAAQMQARAAADPPMSAPVARNRYADADRAAMEHLDACETASAAMGEDRSLSWEEAGGPAINGDWYCACEDCERRELIAAVWPHALAYAADLIAEHLPVQRDAGASAAMKLLRAEAQRSTLAGLDVPA